MKNHVLTLTAAVAGGVIGYFAFQWLLGYGLYAMILPGGLVGLGAGIGKSKSLVIAVACGLIALAFGIFTRWRFNVDVSLGYFLTHLSDLSPVTLLMLAVGTFIGFWVPFRRRQDALRPASS